jgi:CelD/BcsL family acetyltransferase involved in cellulose biosynthesis
MDDIEIVSGFEAIARLDACWGDAGARAGGIGVFERFDLVRAAAEITARRGAEPLVAVFRCEGRIETLLPLRRERLMGVRAVVPLVYPLAQYTDVAGAALRSQDLVRLCRTLHEAGADLLLLRKVRADSGLYEAVIAEAQSQRAADTALYIDLQAYKTFDAYDASYSNKTRRARRQRRQRFEAAVGPLSFEIAQGAVAIAAFDTALVWKRAWLAERGVSSPVFDAGDWEQLLRGTVTSGEAIVSVLRAGEKLAAVEIGFADRTTYVSYLGTYDPDFSSYSAGQHQMLGTIAWAFEQGFQRYDLLAPADDYKRLWTREDTGVAIDDYAIGLTHIGRGVAELRRHVRPLARDFYHRLSPEMRVAGGRYGVPAAAAAAAAMCASAVIAAME